jgi:branched-chain amino acid transport system substrate-binding protein
MHGSIGLIKVLICILVLSINVSLGFTADSIKVGVAGPHSGSLASYGIPTARAAELVKNKYNENGGVLGKNIELITEDDQCDPTTATSIATQLVAEGIDVVLGHICSGATLAALEVYKNAPKVVLSPASTNTHLTQSGEYPNFFRTIAPDDEQVRLQVEFALDILNINKFAIVHDNSTYGKDLAEYAKTFLEADSRAVVVAYESITPGLSDYSNLVQIIEQSNAEATIYGGSHPEASKIITQIREMNMDTLFISGDAIKDDAFIAAAGDHAEGVYASAPTDMSNNSLYQLAVEEHIQAYGEDPGAFFAQAYAGAMVLLEAIVNAGSTDYAAVRNSLLNDFFITPLGRIRFDEKGDAIGVGFSIYKVIDSEFVEVYFKDMDKKCYADFDEDYDVDGEDLVEFGTTEKEVTLERLAEEFGRTDCI